MFPLRKWIKFIGQFIFHKEKNADFSTTITIFCIRIKRFRHRAAYHNLREESQNLWGEFRVLQESHTELQGLYWKLQESHVELQASHREVRESHTELQGLYWKLQESHAELQASHREVRESHTELQGLHWELHHAHGNLLQRFDTAYFDSFQDRQWEMVKDETYPECVKSELKKIKDTIKYVPNDCRHNYWNLWLNLPEFCSDGTFRGDEDVYICYEMMPLPEYVKILEEARRRNKKVIFASDSFLKCFTTFADEQAPQEYRKGISFTTDDIASHYDATRSSRLELMLNDKEYIVTREQKQRAQDCIDKIVSTHLSKYNHQPIYEPKIGRDGVKKILVVDQSYGDRSIAKGMASEVTFEKMLECAIAENPDVDIIVKTHPDTMTGNRGGYYTKLKPHDNIYTMTEPINPISLIKYCDKVYVCTSQFGFEALMCGKEVHVFGMPFYAGWGLTRDRQKCDRRNNTRSLEEVFYLAYIVYSHYVNPEKQCRCEIEEAMEYLLKLREKGFTQNL